MATNHTTNYQLNLWQPTDKFSREEINENTQKLDAAVKAVDTKANGKADASAVTAAVNTLNAAVADKADAATLAALSQTVSAKGNCRIVVGTYTGTGEYGSAHPTGLDFANTVGKAPAFLFIGSVAYRYLMCARGMTSLSRSFDEGYGYYVYFTWTDTGVSWYNGYEAAGQMNGSGTVYTYIALFD